MTSAITTLREKPLLMLAGSAVLILLHGGVLEVHRALPEGFTAACMMAVFVAATVSSIAGFAFSPICAVLLQPFIGDPVQLISVLLVSSIAIQVLTLCTLWRSVDVPALLPFLMGGVLGLPAGIWLLLHVEASIYTRVIGAFLIVYGFVMLLRKPIILRSGPVQDAVVGALGGVAGGLAAFPGATVTIWCGTKGWNKERQRGVYQPFILVMQVLCLIAIGAMSPQASGPGIAAAAWAFVPAAILGTCCGLAIFRRINDGHFRVVVNLLLIVSGVGLSA